MFKCPICRSVKLIKGINGMRCKKCGYQNLIKKYSNEKKNR